MMLSFVFLSILAIFVTGAVLIFVPEIQRCSRCMDKYYEKEEALFKRWEARINENETNPDFAPDGMLYRGEITYVANQDGTGYWSRSRGPEAMQWDSAARRLLILTKDLYDDCAWDIREETGRLNDTGKDSIKTNVRYFYPNLTLWAYAILNALSGNDITEYEMTPSWDKLREFYETAPISRVNCKKTVGGSRCLDNVLKHHLDAYGDLLLEQIRIYDADIILCCGGSGMIKDYVIENYMDDFKPVSKAKWVYHSASSNKILIDSYHPSSFSSKKRMYDEMMNDVKLFLNL